MYQAPNKTIPGGLKWQSLSSWIRLSKTSWIRLSKVGLDMEERPEHLPDIGLFDIKDVIDGPLDFTFFNCNNFSSPHASVFPIKKLMVTVHLTGYFYNFVRVKGKSICSGLNEKTDCFMYTVGKKIKFASSHFHGINDSKISPPRSVKYTV